MTTLAPLDVLALTIFGEARDQHIEGEVAVGNVCRNRLKTNRWGASYERVCLAPGQFSCWSPHGGLSNYTLVMALREQIMAGSTPDDRALRECYWVATGILNNSLQDNTEAATHYFVTRSQIPTWAVNKVPVTVIGAHSFFEGIA